MVHIKYMIRKVSIMIIEVEEDYLKWEVNGEKRSADFSDLIDVYEKSIPKKIIHPGCFDAKGKLYTWNGIDGVPYDLCPTCKKNLCTSGPLGRAKMNYCENCGQALDWN